VTQETNGSGELIEEYVSLLVANASCRAERDELVQQLKTARSEIRRLAEWRLALIAALPIAAIIAAPQHTTRNAQFAT
jgi:hypothetical protein